MSSSMKKQSIDYSLIAAAHHEAAHTIVALLNLIQVSDVAVKVDGSDAVGLTQFYMYKNSNTEDKELSEILILLDLQIAYAGLAGEKHYYRDICGSNNFPSNLKAGSSEDFSTAQKLIRTHNLAAPGKETSVLKKKLQSEVEQMLIAYWDDVKLVAYSLYKRRKLYYRDLKNLLCRAPNENRTFWKSQFKLINIIHHDIKVPPEQEVKEALHKNIATIIR
jgi:hypothetical protein